MTEDQSDARPETEPLDVHVSCIAWLIRLASESEHLIRALLKGGGRGAKGKPDDDAEPAVQGVVKEIGQQLDIGAADDRTLGVAEQQSGQIEGLHDIGDLFAHDRDGGFSGVSDTAFGTPEFPFDQIADLMMPIPHEGAFSVLFGRHQRPDQLGYGLGLEKFVEGKVE